MGDARPSHARRRRRRAGRGLVHYDTPVALLVTLGVGSAGAGRDRRMGGTAHRHGIRAGRALRRRGRRVPDRSPQRLRRARVRRVGARDRGRPLPVPGRRVAAAVDARAAAAAPVAQGRRGDAGDRADGRGRWGPAPRCHAGPPRRRARPAHGSIAQCTWWLWRRRDQVPELRTGMATVLTVLAVAARLGRCRRAERGRAELTAGAFARLPSSSSSSSSWPCCCPPPGAACSPWSWARC